MNNKEIKEFIELLYPFLREKLEKDFLKNCVKRKNATVISVLGKDESNIWKEVSVVLPYDATSFSVRNETGIDLNKDDLVCLEYNIDLKNAIAVYKVN